MSRAKLRKRKRLTIVLSALIMLGVAVSLVLFAFEDNIVFFFGPTDIVQGNVGPGQQFRLGGLVVEESVKKAEDGVTTLFGVSDGAEEVLVSYKGILPDLFREGQGIVAQGSLNTESVFVATEVLAKHDETYMPPEVVEAMKRAGTWQEDGATENSGDVSK